MLLSMEGDAVTDAPASAELSTAQIGVSEALAAGTAGIADCGEARPKRADAIKNRQRILEAAEEVFAAEGVSVPIDTVAERACVGVGTLYRHFPTKEALFEAIVRSKLEELIEMARVYADGPDPEEAFFSFVSLFASQVSNKRDLMDAIDAAGIDFKARCAEQVEELKGHLQRILERAIAAGAIRDDVCADEVVGLIIGACHAAEHSDLPEATCARMVTVVCDGLRRRATR